MMHMLQEQPNLSNFDKLFDSLYSSSPKGPKLHHQAIPSDSIHKQFLIEIFALIRSIKVINHAKEDITTLKCFLGLCMTINGVLSLWSVLQGNTSIQCAKETQSE